MPTAQTTEGADFAEIFRAHAPRVWRALRRLGVREADVEDLCQEVFVVVHRKLPAFEGRSALSTWIYGDAALVDRARRRSSRAPGGPAPAG